MKKVAIFVEGYTEFYFLERMIAELAGWGKVRLELAKQHAGRLLSLKTTGAPQEKALIHVLLVNCCGDGSVKSFILERKSRLAEQGYTHALGLQDLYPKPHHDLEKFKSMISTGLEDEKMDIKMCIAVAEIEAWFLGEGTHYTKINPNLSHDSIRETLDIDLTKTDIESEVRHPSRLLKNIYNIVGVNYNKKEAEIKRVISALDYEELYTTTREKSKSLNSLLERLDYYFFDSEKITSSDPETTHKPMLPA